MVHAPEVWEALIYNKIEQVLLISKLIFDYYNTNFSLEITSKVQKCIRNIHLHTNEPPNAAFRQNLYFLAQPSRNGTHRIVGYQRQRRIHLCMMHACENQMKVSHETESEANFGFRRALMPSYLGMCPLKRQLFFSFQMQSTTTLSSEYSKPKGSDLRYR